MKSLISISPVAAEVTRLKLSFCFCVSLLCLAEGKAEDILKVSFVVPRSVPASIQRIASTTNLAPGDRLEAVLSLGEKLSREEITALYSFLKSPSAREEKDLPVLYGLKNEILNVLRHQTAPSVGFTRTMVEIYSNQDQDSVLRDYAIQHLTAWYEQGAPDAPDAKEKIRAVLRLAAHEPNGIAGTALLGMHRLSAESASFDGKEIDQFALAYARSTGTDLATRITAIQVCSERGIKAVLPAIESLPQQAGSLPLRLSATAAMGQLDGQGNWA